MMYFDDRLYLIAGAALITIGLYALLAHRHFLRRILALNVMGSGVFMVLITYSARTAGSIPDPVPHAMVITGIVVSICATGLALVLAECVQALTGRTELSDERETSEHTGARPDTSDEQHQDQSP